MKNKKTSYSGLVTMIILSGFFTPAQAEFQSRGNFFEDFETNGDGVVSKGEYIGPEKKFSTLDSDGNGIIEAGEGPTGSPTGHAKNGGDDKPTTKGRRGMVQEETDLVEGGEIEQHPN